ncbi:MAG: hypothetical protein M1269_00265 [Chloroflexi bacterium]|nr:hypothetical protein [Chloroflexota bacterium]
MNKRFLIAMSLILLLITPLKIHARKTVPILNGEVCKENKPALFFSQNGNDVVLSGCFKPAGVWVFNMKGILSFVPGKKFVNWMNKGRSMLVENLVSEKRPGDENSYNVYDYELMAPFGISSRVLCQGSDISISNDAGIFYYTKDRNGMVPSVWSRVSEAENQKMIMYAAHSPRVSTAGTRVSFTPLSRNHITLYLADGTMPVEIRQAETADYWGFSYDDAYLVFWENHTLAAYKALYGNRLEPAQPPPPYMANIGRPVWSGNSHRIAFAFTFPDGVNAAGFWDLVTGGILTYAVETPGVFADTPAWSPDGRWVACKLVNSEGGLPFGLEAYNSGGKEKKSFPVFPYDVQWSPDSSRLLVREVGDRFCVINFNNGDITELKVPGPGGGPPSEYDGSTMAWDPEGDRVVIGLRGDGIKQEGSVGAGCYSYHVYIVDVKKNRTKKIF